MAARVSPDSSRMIWPSFIMTVRLPSFRAEGTLWVIIRQVMWFSATIFFVSASTFSAVAGSNAAVCSSRSRSLGVTRVAISKVNA